MPNTSQHECVFKAVSEDEQLVYGEVYAPLRPDSDGDIMDADTIKKMAHDFLRTHKLDQIDVQHDNNLNPGASVVESFIARKGDDTFIEGSWVVGVHIPDAETWNKVKKGEINGFSIEALVTKTPQTLEVELPPVINGITTKSEDHEHQFFVTFDGNGAFMGGRTNIEKGHFHTIRAGTVTDLAQDHNHRFSFVEGYTNPTQMAAILKAAAECEVYPHGIKPEPVAEVVTKEVVSEAVVEAPEVAPEVIEKAAISTTGANSNGVTTGATKVNPPPESTQPPNKAETIQSPDTKPLKKKNLFKLAIKEAITETLSAMGLTQESVEKGGVGSGRRNKNAAAGPWVVHNTDTGELHAVHPSYGKAMNHADKLNEEHFNDPNTVPDKHGMISGKYGAMVKTSWDAMHPPVSN